MSKENLFTLSDYFEVTKFTNKVNDMIDVRYYFFYHQKLKKLMVMHKSVTTNPEKTITRTSTTAIRPLILEKPITKTEISALTANERQDFILNNSSRILYDDSQTAVAGKTQTRVDTFSDGRDPEYVLEYLLVGKPYRNCGLASMLINEAKNSSINNDIFRITGEMMPIDDQPKHFFKFRKWINEIYRKTGKFPNWAYVDHDALAKVYTKLGFSIDDNPQYTNPKLEMKLTADSIPQNKKLPDEFTRFLRNKHTTMLFA